MARRAVCLAAALLSAGCVESGNYRWDFGRWEPPLVSAEVVEAYRGVHGGRIGLFGTAGGIPRLFVETWRPLVPAGPAQRAAMTYRVDGREHTVPGTLEPRRFAVLDEAMPELLRQLAEPGKLEALVPVAGGGVYPIAFDVSDFSAGHDWVRDECRDL